MAKTANSGEPMIVRSLPMKTDAVIDAFVQRKIVEGCEFTRLAAHAPWIAAFEAKLPARLPPSFRSLILRFRFGPFRASGIEFFGNRGGGERDDLVIASLSDAALARVTRAHRFIQVGRPETRAYDPVCFDMSRRSKEGEAPLVCLDHEEILIHERIRVLRECARSFAAALG